MVSCRPAKRSVPWTPSAPLWSRCQKSGLTHGRVLGRAAGLSAPGGGWIGFLPATSAQLSAIRVAVTKGWNATGFPATTN